MNSFPRIRLQLADGSYGLLVDGQSCGTAIVYVHGFWRHSETTWWQFQTLPDRLADPWWHCCDFYFYSYKSAAAQLWPNISSLSSFLGNVFPRPDWLHLGRTADGPLRNYKQLVLVGHS